MVHVDIGNLSSYTRLPIQASHAQRTSSPTSDYVFGRSMLLWLHTKLVHPVSTGVKTLILLSS